MIVINTIILANRLSGSQLLIIRDYGFIPDNVFHINNIDRCNHNKNLTISDTLTRLFFSMICPQYSSTGISRWICRKISGRYVLICIKAGIAAALFYDVIASWEADMF
ncbi:MAG: hypothetical protein WA667_23530 [Candidatus Nitrosopolaris sp.]